jgi:serine/threonine protein phosphatase PrpC
LQTEIAELSLLGHREENQDRYRAVAGRDAALIAAIDGMGGHAAGARAAEVTVATLDRAFGRATKPLIDPHGFLHVTLGRAHDAVVELGAAAPMDARPRATGAVALLQDGGVFFAHIGDSRVYHLRAGRVVARTRDHSHVELLRREGLITEQEMQGHPMRNFVECCLGGDPVLPEMSIGGFCRLEHGDVILVCTDGLWSGLEDARIAAVSDRDAPDLATAVERLAEDAVAASAPYSDNTTVVALRFVAD